MMHDRGARMKGPAPPERGPDANPGQWGARAARKSVAARMGGEPRGGGGHARCPRTRPSLYWRASRSARSGELMDSMEKIVSLCKRRGFIFPSSEIYGGLNGAWDYGPLGVELKNNLKQYWWRVIVRERDDVVGMDGSILTHRAVLKASGHEDTF